MMENSTEVSSLHPMGVSIHPMGGKFTLIPSLHSKEGCYLHPRVVLFTPHF